MKKRYPEHFSPNQPLAEFGESHALLRDEKRRKMFDVYLFTLRGGKVEIYFDISSVYDQYEKRYWKKKK